MGGKKRYQNPRHEHEDWRGWRFLFVSLSVTTLSIIFFFSIKMFFPTIRQEGLAIFEIVAQRVNGWGGIKLKTVQLTVDTQAEDAVLPELVSSLQKDLNFYIGQSFWFLDLEGVKNSIERKGWVQSVVVHRAFPDRLDVFIKPKNPRFLVRGLKKWYLVDESPSVISMSKEIPGSWTNLPLIFGKEKIFDRAQTVEDLNRRLKDQREDFQALRQLIEALEQKFHARVESASFKEDSWTEKSIVKLRILSENGTDILGETVDEEFDVSLPLIDDRGLTAQRKLESLQFVLSDLRLKGILKAQVLGQFDGRWIVRKTKGT